MTASGFAASLVAPNIFDAFANQNLLLYLVMSNLLSPATWEYSDRIRQRAGAGSEGAAPSARSLIREIQGFLNRNFQHLHTHDVARLYGELDVNAERARLGAAAVERAVGQLVRNLEMRVASGTIPAEAMRPVLERIAEGAFPAYFYGTIDVVRANRKATGKSHASVKGLTSCVDEAAIFASLAMTVPPGAIANVVALAGPSHTSAFGWNSDGEAWWFLGKNRLFFAEDWQDHVAEAAGGDAQACFDALLQDASRIVSVAGTFDLETGSANLIDDHIDEIAAKMDAFFGIRLRQLADGLSKPRRHLPEDPVAPYLRALHGAASASVVLERLGDSRDAAGQGVLYAFRSLAVADLHPYVMAARAQPNCRKLAQSLKTVEDVLAATAGIGQSDSILGNRDRIAMPDETLRFGTGTDRDKALLIMTLLFHVEARSGGDRQAVALLGVDASTVKFGSQYIDAGSGRPREAPAEPTLYRLA